MSKIDYIFVTEIVKNYTASGQKTPVPIPTSLESGNENSPILI
jgi:hypothetical protein